jgi:hypothetical protein
MSACIASSSLPDHVLYIFPRFMHSSWHLDDWMHACAWTHWIHVTKTTTKITVHLVLPEVQVQLLHDLVEIDHFSRAAMTQMV